MVGTFDKAGHTLAAVAQLQLDAINARMETGWSGFLLSLVRGTRWEYACGFCKEEVRTLVYMPFSSTICPHCGTRNILPSRYWGRPRST